MGGIYLAGLVLILSFVLGKVSDFTAASVRRLSLRFKINEFITAFFFLGIATSIPEIAVAVFSAIRGVPELSFGNLIGANIVILTFMIGLAAVFSGKLSVHKAIHRDDFFLTLMLVGLPIPFILNGYISRVEGLVMMVAYGYFLLHFFWRRRAYRKQSKATHLRGTVQRDIAIFLVSSIVLLIVSYVLVQVSLTAAAALGIPILVVGLLMISLGTNVPEVSFVLNQASRRYTKDKDIVTGVLLGNVVLNTPTLGLLALIRPFSIGNLQMVWVSAAFLAVVLYATWVFFLSERKLTRREGILLLLLYALFVGYQLGLFSRLFPGSFS
ncbi:MAG: hypothetical protein WD200_02335 [Candidatus Andersenbacteria bacterium]